MINKNYMNKNQIKTVIKEGQEPTPVEILEQSILDIATSARALMSSRIKPDVVYRLIAWKAGLGVSETKRIIETVEKLDIHLLEEN